MDEENVVKSENWITNSFADTFHMVISDFLRETYYDFFISISWFDDFTTVWLNRTLSLKRPYVHFWHFEKIAFKLQF